LLAAIPALAGAAPPEGGEEPPAQLAFEPGSYDFGLQPLNDNPSQATLRLRNNGTAPAQVSSTEISGGNGAFWPGPSDCNGRTLNPNETCSVQIYFGPYDAVPFSAQLRASSEGGANFTADLSGEGGRPILSAATDPTNFGSAPVGSGGVTKTIDVTNKGNLPGSAFIAVISGGAVGSFHLLDENCTGVLLSPAATCNLQVSFEPLSTGAKTARLFLVADGDGGTQITLSGIGVEPEAGESEAASSTAVGAAPKPRQRHRARPRTQRRGLGRVGLAYKRLLH
jgi:hypothetical protein